MTISAGKKGVDFSGARPSIQQLQADNDVFVARYSAPNSESWKKITLAEAQSYWNAGIHVVLVFEDGAQNALGGMTQGNIDGQIAAQDADALGWPGNVCVYASADFDIQQSDYQKAADYLIAFGHATGRPVGIYGPRRFIDWCIAQGCAQFGWQCASTYGDSYNAGTTQVGHICQQVGNTTIAGTDRDIALQVNIGSWNGQTAPAPEPGPQPQPQPQPNPQPSPPETNVQSVEVTLSPGLDNNGNGYYSAAALGVTDVNKIINIVWIDEDPGSVGHYDRLPAYWGITSDEKVVVNGGAPGATYGCVVWYV